MSRLSMQEHGQQIFDGARAFVENAASNPKVATVVATSSAGMGYMSPAMIESVVGTITLIVGCITGLIVMTIQGIKLMRMLNGKE